MKKILSAILVLLSITALTACSQPFPTEEHASTNWMSTDGKMYLSLASDGTSVSGEVVLTDNQRISYKGEFADGKLILRNAKVLIFDGKRLMPGTEMGSFGYEYNGTTLVIKVGSNEMLGTNSGQILFKKVVI